MSDLRVGLQTHIRELDGVRGIAIGLVLIWHYFTCQGALGCSRLIAKIGHGTTFFWSGVDLFFVLSGFLIGGILLDYGNRTGFYQTFYIRRLARIIPVYVLLLGLHFCLRAVLDPERFNWLFKDTIPDLAYVTFTQNIFMGNAGSFGGHFLAITWSLAVEEQFYVMLPLLLYFAGPKHFIPSIIVLTAFAPFLRLMKPGFWCFVNMPTRMDALLLGVLLAAIFRSDRIVDLLHQHRRYVWCIFIMLAISVSHMTVPGIGQKFIDPTVIALFYATFVTLVLLHRDQAMLGWLRSTILVRLGMYSYGIYMYHQMIAGLMHGALRSAEPSITTTYGATLTLLSLLIAVALAVLSYHTYEAYFLRLGRRYRYASAPSSSSPDSAALTTH